ncbi:MAG TPA: prepilin-type N-terminal cleavage/methylation domain-containing protein [Candidatus Omnitrophota bacterium]|nr:prepilin-type N-terminal cleavage/methylation domain-containing protein [Candidatus Omnitrophota bacterium]HPS19639.1 prepilin-type N-terminal cleavage/methylation domain-containing protein [Candidatus Omnitrophota bacterium]
MTKIFSARADFKNKGFTLVEIMIVVAIIALIAAVALPNFMKNADIARRNTCLSNLKLIDGAKTLWAIETGTPEGDTVSMVDIVSAYIKKDPICPSGGTYDVGEVGTAPTCTKSGHVLAANT